MANKDRNTAGCSYDLGLLALVFRSEEQAKTYQAARARQLFALTAVLVKHDFALHHADTKSDVFWLLDDLNAEFQVVSGLGQAVITGDRHRGF